MFKIFYIILHFILVGFIILCSLLHQGKGAEAGMSYNDNKTTHVVFGSRGSADFFFKIILFFFFLFLVTTITLTKITIIKNDTYFVEKNVKEKILESESKFKDLDILNKDKKLPNITI